MVEFDPLRSSFVALVGEELVSFKGYVVRSLVSLRYSVWLVLSNSCANTSMSNSPPSRVSLPNCYSLSFALI